MSFRNARLAVPLVAAAAVFGLAACGSSGNGSKSASPSGTVNATLDKTIAAEVPAAIKKKGSLTVATDASYPPVESFAPDGKTIVGVDPDLGKALGQVMGVKLPFKNTDFAGIVPGLASGKFGLAMSAMTDNREREKTVDFVVYFGAATSFYAKQGGPSINGLADLCGHKVGAEKGTTQVDDATASGKKCKAAGKPGVQVLVFPDQNGVNLALSSGRADIGMADSPVVDYQVKKTGGQFKVIGKKYGPFPYGIAIPKKSGMVKPIQDALKVLIAKGQYQAVLKKWGVQGGAVSTPKVNGAIN
jgi:polar amino acid transport system substrate-binding protein